MRFPNIVCSIKSLFCMISLRHSLDMEQHDTPKKHILHRLRRLIAGWMERSAQRQRLAELERHRLDDIGIDPYDRERECRKRFFE